MKTLITLIFVLAIGATAHAQNPNILIKVKTIATSIDAPTTGLDNMVKKENSISVIYIYKNAKIKKALSFTTTSDNAKLA